MTATTPEHGSDRLPGPRCCALLVAAGRGSRFGEGLPKQYRLLGGVAILRRAAEAFLAVPRVARVRVVIHPDDRALYDAAVGDLDLPEPVPGGASRQESVRLGLESLARFEPDRVLIHDAARPLVSRALIEGVLDALDAADGAIPALPVVDSLKRAAEDDPTRIEAGVDRARLWRAQTPQGFRYSAILAAHQRLAGRELTDDAAVAEAAGLRAALTAGDENNLKVTTDADLHRLERLLMSETETFVGSGYDVHRFGPGDHVMLCGLRVPHACGLLGHSDADVALHAITDALLGAVGAGDIGMHFPPSDPQWRGAPSRRFLERAHEIVRAAGGAVVNVDVTIIGERPKVGPHRERMAASLAEILGIARMRVNVKATTTERLGFTGREEGLAAHAVATVARPRPSESESATGA